jgi:short-subunit dehydrogenase
VITARRVLLTGAAGGIGVAIARELLQRGAAVLLTGRSAARLQQLAAEFGSDRDRIGIHAADLALDADRAALVDVASHWRGGVDALINNAGLNDLALLESQDAAQIDRMLDTNLRAPIQLCRGLLPQLQRAQRADIINVGSVFGSIGYPGYAVYSATKFAMRGFTEALHRELAGSGVRAHYLAPRATRTQMNAGAADRLNADLGTAVDDPAVVAKAVCRMLETAQPFAVLGWPEKLFARINAVMPRLVDGALIKQLPAIRRHASKPGTVAHPVSSLQETSP